MPEIPGAALAVAEYAIIETAADFGHGDMVCGSSRDLARAALEAAAPLLAEAWGITRQNGKTLPEGFASFNAGRTRQAGRRDADLARHALEMLGARCSQRMREVAEARIAAPEAPWSEIAGKLGLTKDQATGLFRRLMDRLHVAQLREAAENESAAAAAAGEDERP